MALSDPQMDKFEAYVNTKTDHRCPIYGGKKIELGYETLVMWKGDAQGSANFVNPDRG